MIFKMMSRQEAEKVVNDWTETGIPKDIDLRCPNEYIYLRKCLLDEAQFIREEESIAHFYDNPYLSDLRFGLKLYHVLGSEFGFSVRSASDDGIWRFLSIRVIPDIIADRWKETSYHDRFWKSSRRVWLKVIWWYIHLSWQGNEQETYDVLKNNSTDDAVQMVERSGPTGYRVNLCRKMIAAYSITGEFGRRNSLFRKVMKLNTAWLKVVEPSLTEGGEVQYVRNLFEYFKR